MLNEADYLCAKSTLILSQTFYMQNEGSNDKIYLSEAIKTHPTVQGKRFWSEFFAYSIHEEVTHLSDRGVDLTENIKSNQQNLNNLMFSQFVPIADNMFEFGIYIPDDFQTDITHYELWADDYQIGTRTEVNKRIRHLMITMDNVEQFCIRVYSDEEFIDESIFAKVQKGENIETFKANATEFLKAKPMYRGESFQRQDGTHHGGSYGGFANITDDMSDAELEAALKEMNKK